MWRKREEYRQEIRRLKNKNIRVQHRQDIISTSIVNSFLDVEEQVEKLIAEDRVEQLCQMVATLTRNVKEFNGKIVPNETKLLEILAKTIAVNLRQLHQDEEEEKMVGDS